MGLINPVVRLEELNIEVNVTYMYYSIGRELELKRESELRESELKLLTYMCIQSDWKYNMPQTHKQQGNLSYLNIIGRDVM